MGGEGNIVLKQLCVMCNIGFCTEYFMEWIHRFRHEGVDAFKNVLHVLDTVIILLSTLERVSSEGLLSNALPPLRLYRVWLFVPDEIALPLALVVDNAKTFTITFGWFTLVSFAVLWALSTWVVELLRDSPAFNESMDPDVEHGPFESFDLKEYFGSTFRTFCSLCQIVSMDDAMDHILRPVILQYSTFLFFLIPVLLVMSYGLMVSAFAVVTAVAATFAKHHQRIADMKNQAERERTAEGVLRVMKMMDDNQDGFLSADEIDDALKLESIRHKLWDVGLPTTMDGMAIVNMIDTSGDAMVSYDEFQESLVMLNNPIEVKDFIKMSIRINSVWGRMKVMQRRFLTLNENTWNTSLLFQYGAKSISVWCDHMVELASVKQAKEMARSYNPYKHCPSAPKEWLMYQYKAPPPSYEKEVTALCHVINRFQPSTPLPESLFSEGTEKSDDGTRREPASMHECNGKDDENQATAPGRGDDNRRGTGSRLRAQSAPTRSKSIVSFEDGDSNASGGAKASSRPSSAALLEAWTARLNARAEKEKSAALTRPTSSNSLSSLSSVGMSARPASTGGVRRRPPSATEGDERPKKAGKEGHSKKKAKSHLREDVTGPGGIGRWDTMPPSPPEVRMPEEFYRAGPPVLGSPPPLPPLPHTLDNFQTMDKAPPKEKGSRMPHVPLRKEDIMPPPDDHIFLAMQKQRDKKAAFRQLLS